MIFKERVRDAVCSQPIYRTVTICWKMKTAVLLLLLIPLFRVSLSSDLQVTKTLIRDQHLGVSIGNFEIHKSHRLFNASVMGVTSKEDQPTDCAFTCIGLPWCLSYNFQKTADKHGKHLCEALSIDKYNNSKDFQADEDFDHFSISVSFVLSSISFDMSCDKAHKFIAFLIVFFLPVSFSTLIFLFMFYLVSQF